MGGLPDGNPSATGTTRWRALPTVMVGGGLLVMAAACGGSSGGSAAGGPSSSTAPTSGPAASSSPAASTASTGGNGSTGGTGQTVTVTETEFKLVLSTTSFTPGTYTFVADDKGSVTHALEIDGPGVEDKKTGELSPGAHQSLTVTLRKGTYELYCPVDGHKQLGMDTHITVG